MQQDPRKQPTAKRNTTQKRPSAPPNPGRNQPSPPPYRSAAPYTVPPRTNGQKVPYPPSEMRRRQMIRMKQRQKRRRKRILLLLAVTLLCLLLLAGLITAAVLAIKEAISTETDIPGDIVTPPGISDQIADTAAAPIPAETEPPLPDYPVPNKVLGDALRPETSERTVTLGDTVSCSHAILINAETGAVVAQKNAEDIIFPASMTKLMTILVAYESIADLDEPFRMTQEIIDPLYLDGLSLAGFAGGEEITVRDLLYGSALPSGAEASYALAIAACGSEETFVDRMNDRALLLGMYDTHFENCTGAHHNDHVSTLTDIGILMAFIMQNDELAEIFGTYQYTTTPTVAHPEGLILTSTVYSRMEGSESGVCTVLGGKTGYTAQGGQCLATYAERTDSRTSFVCVTAGGETKWRPVYDSIYLYQFYTGDYLPTEPPPSIAPTE